MSNKPPLPNQETIQAESVSMDELQARSASQEGQSQSGQIRIPWRPAEGSSETVEHFQEQAPRAGEIFRQY